MENHIARIVVYICFFVAICNIVLADDRCLRGPYHKQKPEPETSQFHECRPWKSLACCTPGFTAALKQNQTRTLYNHTWHRCEKLSAACERFWMNQECFYQCSPYIHAWEDPHFKGAIKGVPICASVCDRWYEACKTDKICVEDVITGYNFTEHGENYCPADKPCITYEQMYGSGKALCEKMWGPSYKYVAEKKDSSNCMVMWFHGSNPNKGVKKENGTSQAMPLAAYMLLTIAVLLNCLIEF